MQELEQESNVEPANQTDRESAVEEAAVLAEVLISETAPH
jgi:hypothetical protein